MSALRRKERASRLYAALALLTLACVLSGALFCQSLVQSYRRSVDGAQEWVERLAQAEALARTTLDAAAPGRDLFVTRGVAAARTGLAELGASYLRASARARTGLADLPTSELRVLARHLERANAAFDAMLIEAEGCFAAFDRADPSEASRRSAAMERQLALTSRALGELMRAERALQQRALAEQASRAATLERWTWVLVALVALLIALALGHGRLLSARLGEAQAAIEQRDADMQRLSEEARESAEVFARALDDREGVVEQLAEASGIVAALSRGGLALVHERALLHTLKDAVALLSLTSLARLCHELEGAEHEPRGLLQPAERQRLALAWDVAVGRLRRTLGQARVSPIEVDDRELSGLIASVLSGQSGPPIATRLAAFRLELASRRLERLGEQARVFARRIGKPDLQVKLEANGVRLSRERWGHLWSTLGHVVRNAIDHGIEPGDERLRAGKTAAGTLAVRTLVRDNRLHVWIADDGRGVDWARVRSRAKQLGMPADSQQDLVAALFAPGFYTGDGVSPASGRGLGLSAVEQALRELGGTVEIEAAPGHGTTFHFVLPYVDIDAALQASLRPVAA